MEKHRSETPKKLHTTNRNWNFVLIFSLSLLLPFTRCRPTFSCFTLTLAFILWFFTWNTWSYSRYIRWEIHFFFQVCKQMCLPFSCSCSSKSMSSLRNALLCFCSCLWDFFFGLWCCWCFLLSSFHAQAQDVEKWHIKPFNNSKHSHTEQQTHKRKFLFCDFQFYNKTPAQMHNWVELWESIVKLNEPEFDGIFP